MSIYELISSRRDIIDRVLQLNNNLNDLTIVAESSPRAFFDSIWPWFLEVMGVVGSPMTGNQMKKAQDEHILKLFEDFTDNTEWDHPKRGWPFIGGSIQASREFAAFAEKEPERAKAIILNFRPGEQERPAGRGISGLLKTGMPSIQVFDIVFNLHSKGFSSREFRRDVSRGLSERAKKDKGLPDNILELIRNWYREEDYPSRQEND